MRTYGRDASGKWVEITTDDNGYNDKVFISNLIQNLRLSPGESPFYANNGIPAQPSVIQQILPTYYVNRVQQQFSPYFSSLQIAMISDDPPVYNTSVITNSGAKIIQDVEA